MRITRDIEAEMQYQPDTWLLVLTVALLVPVMAWDWAVGRVRRIFRL